MSHISCAILLGTLTLALGVHSTHAATYSVTNVSDNGAGSLRAALQSANATPEADTINFAPRVRGTLALTGGQIEIGGDVTIAGPGKGVLTLSGNGASRIFNVKSGTVAISALSLADGRVTGTAGTSSATGAGTAGGVAYGGALYNSAKLSLVDVVFANNTAVGGVGGASYNASGARGGEARGGAVFNLGTLSLDRVTFQNNIAIGGAGGSARGGSISTPIGPQPIRTRGGDGGNALGGALYNGGTLTINNVTHQNNSAVGGAAGISGYRGSVGMAIEADIRDIKPTATSAAFSLDQALYFRGQLEATGDFLTYSIASGKLPEGLELNATTGVISGTPTGASLKQVAGFRVSDGFRTSNTATLTFNTELAEPGSLFVTTLSDESTSTDRQTSLREAMAYAARTPGDDEITFSSWLGGNAAITLKGGPLPTVDKGLTINWSNAGLLNIIGGASSVFNVSSGSKLNLSRLKITGVRGTASAISNKGTSNFSQCVFSDNQSSTQGGFITSSGTLNIDRSLLSGNTGAFGGAIYSSGPLTLTNSTLIGNVSGSGSGIIEYLTGGPVVIDSCTITGNSSSGIRSSGSISLTAQTRIVNSLIVDNKGTDLPTLLQTLKRNGVNVPVSNSILSGTAAQAGLETDIKGDVFLNSNGGDIPTIALVDGSPAINTGQTELSVDGRGLPRPVGAQDDIGAFERQSNESFAPFLKVGAASVLEGNSGLVNLTFPLTLSWPSTKPIKVTVRTGLSPQLPATPNTDFVPLNPTVVTFAPGQTTGTVNVQVKGDIIYEGNEYVQLLLSSPQGARLVATSATGTIIEDESSLAFSINDTRLSEGNSGSKMATFTVKLSRAATTSTTVQWSTDNTSPTTATMGLKPGAGVDYIAVPLRTLTFAPGQVSQTVSVQIQGDNLYELDEIVTVKLQNAAGASIADDTGLCTIVNDEPIPVLSAKGGSVLEGNSGLAMLPFTFQLSGPSSLPASFTVFGSFTDPFPAYADHDFKYTLETLTFAPGETTKTFFVPVIGDRIDEENESVTLLIYEAQGLVIAKDSVQGFILNDDKGTPPKISVNDIRVVEGNDGTRIATFTISLSTPTERAISVNYATVDNTASASSDYVALTGSVSFEPGSPAWGPGETSKTVSITINGDTLEERDEVFTLALSQPVNATLAKASGRCTIQNDDFTTILSVKAASVTEGAKGSTQQLPFTLQLSRASTVPMSVTVRAIPGAPFPATTGSDFKASLSTIKFAPGERTKTFNVTVLGDTLDEENENIALELTNPQGIVMGQVKAQGIILNDDAAPTLSVNDIRVVEGNTGTRVATFTVALSAPSAKAIRVNYATTNNTASSSSDYVALKGSLVFEPGETRKTVSISVKGDILVETDETFTLVLSRPANATLAKANGVCTIQNDDRSTTAPRSFTPESSAPSA